MQTTPFPSAQTTPPLPEEIAALAQQLHVDGGRQTGLSLDDWLCAEYFLTQLRAATEEWWTVAGNAPARAKVSSVGEQSPNVKKAPARTPRKTPRPAPHGPAPLPMAASAFVPATAPERPMIHAFQETDHQQSVPVLAAFEMAIPEWDRWRGINE